MKFGIVYYWSDDVDVFDLAEDFMELRVFDDDLKNNYAMWKKSLKILQKSWTGAITIHMPEYFTAVYSKEPILVDLSNPDKTVLKNSLDIVSGMIKFAKTVNASKLILHPGGISEKLLDERSRRALILNLKKSLTVLYSMDFKGEILLENMPWFYWRKDGRRWFSNICIHPEDFNEFLDYCDGIALDLSHGYLSCAKGSDRSLDDFVSLHRKHIHYLHVSDALPPDNEGLQIGEGNIDFHDIFNKLEKESLWLVPEVWKGHENRGEGFKVALDRINELI